LGAIASLMKISLLWTDKKLERPRDISQGLSRHQLQMNLKTEIYQISYSSTH
jgi:hypothetical protein